MRVGSSGSRVHTAGAFSADPSPLTCALPITGPLPKSAGPHDAPNAHAPDRYSRARGRKPCSRIRAPAGSSRAARPIQQQLPGAIVTACRSCRSRSRQQLARVRRILGQRGHLRQRTQRPIQIVEVRRIIGGAGRLVAGSPHPWCATARDRSQNKASSYWPPSPRRAGSAPPAPFRGQVFTLVAFRHTQPAARLQRNRSCVPANSSVSLFRKESPRATEHGSSRQSSPCRSPEQLHRFACRKPAPGVEHVPPDAPHTSSHNPLSLSL